MEKTKTSSETRNGKAVPEGRWRAWFGKLVLFCGVSVYTELCLHLFVFRSVVKHSLYVALFGIMAGLLAALIVSVLPKVLQRIAALILVLLQVLLAEVQLIYHAVFGNLMPISQVRLGGGVVSNFTSQIIYAIRLNWLPVLLLLLPLLLLIVLMIWRKSLRIRLGWRQALATLGLLAAVAVATFGLMKYGCQHTIPVWQLLVSDTTSTDTSYRNLGMTATTAQELRFMLLMSDEEQPGLIQGDLSAVPVLWDPEAYNVLPDLNLKALSEETEDADLAALDRFFAGRTPTKKNADTGRMQDWNVIEICAESYCPWFLSEELTPTLWKMSRSGLVFENYYGSFNSMTSNGEYTLCIGLYPDVSRAKTNTSFDVSVGHTLPFCLGSAMREEGYVTYAYHNYLGEFYNRLETHPSMGYTFKSSSSGLDITIQWPSSDLEMFQASVGDYLYGDDPFSVYYMTFSGHYQYNDSNAMVVKHWDEVRDLPYNDNLKGYIACNLELEYSMEFLLQELEAAGKLDNTVIVLTNDHYPYGLGAADYDTLVGHEVDKVFEKYQNHFICYAPGLGETRVIDSYCSTADILPTMLNLLGVSYDSRLLAGKDVLSDAEHIAVLADGSFLTEEFRYDSETGTVIPADPAAPPDDETVQSLRDEVTNRFTLSREILYADYYAHVCSEAAKPVTDNSGVPFLDAKDVSMQADLLLLYNKGLMDLIGERKIGARHAAITGDYLTAIYRYLGSPETNDKSLPADYLAGREPEIVERFRDDVCRDAVCWGFQTGILREGDEFCDYDTYLNNVWICTLMYRTAPLLEGRDMSIDESAINELEIHNDWMTEEEWQAIAWCLDKRAFRAVDMEGIFDDSYSVKYTRADMARALIQLLYPEMDTKPR